MFHSEALPVRLAILWSLEEVQCVQIFNQFSVLKAFSISLLTIQSIVLVNSKNHQGENQKTDSFFIYQMTLFVPLHLPNGTGEGKTC